MPAFSGMTKVWELVSRAYVSPNKNQMSLFWHTIEFKNWKAHKIVVSPLLFTA